MTLPYKFEEFSKHFQDAMAAASPHSHEGPKWADAYFAERYSDEAERQFKKKRFSAAISFVESHITELNQDGYGVFGKDRGGLTFDSLLTLFGVFSNRPDEGFAEPVTWEEFEYAFRLYKKKA